LDTSTTSWKPEVKLPLIPVGTDLGQVELFRRATAYGNTVVKSQLIGLEVVSPSYKRIFWIHSYYISPQQLTCRTGNTEPWKTKLMRGYAWLYKILEDCVMCATVLSNAGFF